MSSWEYKEKVVDHFNNPRNVGALDKDSSDVGTGLVGAPECGDVMKLQIKVDDETGVISDVKFKTFGCGRPVLQPIGLEENQSMTEELDPM